MWGLAISSSSEKGSESCLFQVFSQDCFLCSQFSEPQKGLQCTMGGAYLKALTKQMGSWSLFTVELLSLSWDPYVASREQIGHTITDGLWTWIKAFVRRYAWLGSVRPIAIELRTQLNRQVKDLSMNVNFIFCKKKKKNLIQHVTKHRNIKSRVKNRHKIF